MGLSVGSREHPHPRPRGDTVQEGQMDRGEGEAGGGGPSRTDGAGSGRARRRNRETQPSSLGESKRGREAPIIIIGGNGAEAPSSSALFYITQPRPGRTRTGARLLPRRVHARGALRALPRPSARPPAWLCRCPARGRARVQVRAARPRSPA